MKNLLIFAALVAAAFYFLSPGAMAAIGALIVLVIVHEFGHWIVARLCGLEVPIFSVGMGSSPRLTFGKFWGTEFQITPWLFGGYVAINPEDEAFAALPASKRVAVLVAGVTMNVLVAAAIMFGLYGFAGTRHAELRNISVSQLDTKITIAAEAGLQSGDKIVAVNGKTLQNFEQLRNELSLHKDKPVSLGIERNGVMLNISLTPNSEGRIGFVPTGTTVVVYDKLGPVQALRETVVFTAKTFKMMAGGLLMMMGVAPTPAALPAGAADVHGVVAIVQIGSMAFQDGYYSFLTMVSLISLNLAMLNILPIPLLDGGHLLFIGIEKLTGRPVNKKARGFLSTIFLFLLVALTFYGLFNDIFHPVKFK